MNGLNISSVFRKLAGSNLIERIPSIRTRKNTPTRKASHASTNNGFIMSPTELKKPKSNPQRSSLNLNINNYGNHIETTVTNTNNSFIQMNRGTELWLECITHRVISDRVHRLLVTLSYFRPDRFVQLLSLIPILILLLYYLVSGCLTSLC